VMSRFVSLSQDGQFRDDLGFYNSAVEVDYYGVAFLAEAGYWSLEQRFWDRRPGSGSRSAHNGGKGPKRRQSLAPCRLAALVFRSALTPEHAEGR
jgi:hypothetical protein